MELKIGKKTYKVKFGYKALAKSNVLKDVSYISEALNEEETTLSDIADILDVEARLLLAGLQKYHKDEFGVDYDMPKELENGMDKVYNLLDEYSDDEENDVMDLFGKLVNELMSNGFFKKLSSQSMEVMEQTDATVAPSDHQKKKA